MLNGNKENENRHRPECMKFVVLFNIIQLLHLNEISMRFYGAEYNNIERGEDEFNIVVLCSFASFNIVVLCSIKPHTDQVQVQ